MAKSIKLYTISTPIGASVICRKTYMPKAVADFDYAIKLNDLKGSVYTNRGIALFQMSLKYEGL